MSDSWPHARQGDDCSSHGHQHARRNQVPSCRSESLNFRKLNVTVGMALFSDEDLLDALLHVDPQAPEPFAQVSACGLAAVSIQSFACGDEAHTNSGRWRRGRQPGAG